MTRDDMIGTLADEIVSGTLNHRTIALDTILERHMPLFDLADTASILEDNTQGARSIKRMRDYAHRLTVSWLQTDPRGVALVDERMWERKEMEIERG